MGRNKFTAAPVPLIIALLVLAAFLVLKSCKRMEHNAFWTKAAPAYILEGRAKIEDGDSLKINGQRVRLVGIDAPELNQYCYKGEESYACGRIAGDYLRNLIHNCPVRCHWAEKDKYKRILGHCFAGDNDLNRIMVADGWAVDYSSRADGDNNYKKEERKARQDKRGIWQWRFERPRKWRKQNPRI